MDAKLAESYELEGYEDRPLSAKEVIKILGQHDTNTTTVFIDGVLFVTDIDLNETHNTNDWKLFDLLHFLNY